MPINAKYIAEFEENGIYHIYNKTNNKELLFITDENRLFFLQKFSQILSPFLDVYCWCLLPNHFHFLVKIKTTKAITETLHNKTLIAQTTTEKKYLKNDINIGALIEQSFRRFFQSYAQAFNKENNRDGNLFYKPFKRVHIKEDEHFTQTIIYIHANALKHGITNDFTKYKWSSWGSILSKQKTNVLREEILEWFGGAEKFIQLHKDNARYYYEYDDGLEE